MTPAYISEPSEADQSARVLLDCYLSSILSLAECLEAACPPVGVQYFDQLMRIRQRLAHHSGRATVEDARQTLDITLEAYAQQARPFCEMRTEDRISMLNTLDQMEEVAQEQALELEPLIGDMRRRLMAWQQLTTVDPLTGLANRRELDRQVNLRLASGKAFCALFFDIDRFGEFNERFGRDTGDQVLKQFAACLKTQIRARDVAARWLADEFIIILECDMENARRRLGQIAQLLAGVYQSEKHPGFEIGVSAAVVESQPEDTARKIWLRLEEEFHTQNSTVTS